MLFCTLWPIQWFEGHDISSILNLPVSFPKRLLSKLIYPVSDAAIWRGTDVKQLEELGRRWIPSDKLPHNYGNSPFLMGKSTISMAMFNSFLYVYQRVVTIYESGYGLALHSLDIPKRFQHAAWAVPCRRLVSKNMLLHTYKRHDHHHHHDHHHIKIIHPLWTICWLGYIITSTLSS